MIGAGRPSMAKSIFYRCSKEICLASALGGVPVLCQWQSAERLRDMVELLLTDSFLMSYFALLTGLFALAAGLEFKWRFFSDSHQLWMKRLHHFLGEIGSSFLTAVRTALGATLGFMIAWHWAEPRTASFEGIFTLVVLTICATAASAALAFLDEILWDVRRAAAAAKN